MPKPEDMPIIGAIWEGLTPEEMDDLPIFGDVWRAQQAIIDFYEFGCFPEYEVWLRTLLPALGEFLFGLLSFGYGDILRGYFRPNSVRGLSRLNRAKLKGKGAGANARAGGKTRFQIPEIGNEIGKSLPASEFFRGRKVTNAEMYFWRIDGLIQRGLWYWLMADLTADFVVNWTTAIMESEECSPTGTFQLAIHSEAEHFTNPNVWRITSNWTLDYEEPQGFWDGTGVIRIPPGREAVITVTARFKNFFGAVMGGEVGIAPASNPTNPFTYSGWPIGEDDDLEEISLFASGVTGDVVPTFKVVSEGEFGSFYAMRVRVQEFHAPAE